MFAADDLVVPVIRFVPNDEAVVQISVATTAHTHADISLTKIEYVCVKITRVIMSLFFCGGRVKISDIHLSKHIDIIYSIVLNVVQYVYYIFFQEIVVRI